MQSLRATMVVITGASSGVGLATSHASARRRELLERAARDCEELGGRSLAVPTDVTDAARELPKLRHRPSAGSTCGSTTPARACGGPSRRYR